MAATLAVPVLVLVALIISLGAGRFLSVSHFDCRLLVRVPKRAAIRGGIGAQPHQRQNQQMEQTPVHAAQCAPAC